MAAESDPPKRPTALDPKDRFLEQVTTYDSGNSEAQEEIQQLRDMLRRNPESLDIKEWLAFKLYSVGVHSEAEHLFRDLIGRDHRVHHQAFYLANLLAKTGREAEAIEWWRKTIELAPTDSKAQKARARILKVKDRSRPGSREET